MNLSDTEAGPARVSESVWGVGVRGIVRINIQ